jgi:uncharacterized protein (TIGR00369 family)
MSLIDAIKAAKSSQDYAAFTHLIPYAQWLGIGADATTGELLGKLSFSNHLIGNPVLPALHGGTIGALLESTAIFQLMWDAESVYLPKTINLTVSYLRSARPTDTWARAVITKQGRRVASVRVDAWQDDRDKPVATATVHLLIKPAD